MAGIDNSSDSTSGVGVVFRLAQRMVSRDAGVRADVAMSATLELSTVLMGIGGPYVLKLLVDALYAGRQSLSFLIGLVALFVLSWTGANVLGVWRMVYSTRAIDRLTEQFATTALRGALPQAVNAREGDSGRTMGQVERLPYSLMIVVDGLIWRAVPLLLQVLGSLWLISGLIPFHYVAIMAAVLAGYVIVTWFGAVQHQHFASAANIAMSNLSRNLADVLRNARRVVLNGATDMEVRRVRSDFSEKVHANTRMIWALVVMSLCQYGLVGAGLLVLLIMGCSDVVAHCMTVGDFVLLQAYAFRLASPLSGFGFILSQAAVSLANIADVMNWVSTTEADAKFPTPKEGGAAIMLDAVNFSYGPGLSGLHDITVELAPGSFTVIVGPNGSGKSTLAQLMAGILEPSRGTVRINDEVLSVVPMGGRHLRVMYVPQAPALFSRSLISNALYPPTTQTEHGLADLLAQWNFYEAGRQIDFGIEVGEQGERLSGGQIQKLELARIAGIKAPAIILDESTSALDPASEETVIRTLRDAFAGNTTLLLITHREGVAAMADQVLFLKGGKLIRHGRHDDLLRDSVSYQKLWVK